ncbi:MAG: hypothetical protein M9921_05720 [Fimbriimonadaceae bacterium]|nr:hypothetical protein [Chthonomonadaceae bacterium]MCO5296338.1 hypothetical protein [Fimbriimonadaceae bacterium]
MARARRFPRRAAILTVTSALWKRFWVKAVVTLLAFAILIPTPYFGLALTMHTYGIYAKPDSAEFTIDGVAVGKSSDFLYRGFMGSDDIECKFKSGAFTKIRVFPRLSDDSSSSLFIHENGDVISYGDLRFERLDQMGGVPGALTTGTYCYPSLPSRMEGPSSSVVLPSSFDSLSHLQAWTRSLGSSLPALTRWKGTQLGVVRVLRSSERESDFVLVFASMGSAWKLAYANLSGVIRMENAYGDLEVAIDGSRNLVMKSRGGDDMTIPFGRGLEAIAAAFAQKSQR